ncbi:MAG: hypothetical protein LW688_13290 [Cryomorphaceae bacterium]|jgi:dsDNA-specific endonuclease/ATPase MutS2|nr:hypothetical protein [Cryomorphaceae bacterium]
MNIIAGILSAFEVGEEVGFLNEKGKGKIIAILSSNKYLMLDSDGFERTVFATELIKIHRVDMSEDVFALNVKKEDLPKSKRSIVTNTISKENVPEKDLHIEELLESHRGMTNSEILEVQMRHLRIFFNEMCSQRRVRFILIHGVGEGVLKSEVHQFLCSQNGVTYFDANFRKYGRGATEVRVNYTQLKEKE